MLVDFLVLDRQERTVPDLVKDDFVLVVSGKEVELASLDLDCPIGASEDARPGPVDDRAPLAMATRM